MIRIERDRVWWQRIACHPEVYDAIGGAAGVSSLLWAVGQPGVMPIADDHGGYVFAEIRPGVLELHSLFTPEGWGREAMRAGNHALGFVFSRGAGCVITYEIEGNPRSRPPKRAGFASQGAWVEGALGQMRMWILTADAWGASPFSRGDSCLLH